MKKFLILFSFLLLAIIAQSQKCKKGEKYNEETGECEKVKQRCDGKKCGFGFYLTPNCQCRRSHNVCMKRCGRGSYLDRVTCTCKGKLPIKCKKGEKLVKGKCVPKESEVTTE